MNSQQPVLVPTTDEGATAVLKSVVGAIGAVTGETVPTSLTSNEELCKWTARSIYSFRDKALNTALTNNLTRGIPPEQLTTCLELMEKLNRALGNSG